MYLLELRLGKERRKEEENPTRMRIEIGIGLALASLLLCYGQTEYIGFFAQDPSGGVSYFDGPFPPWINPDYDGPSPLIYNITRLKAPQARDDCKRCWDCECGAGSCWDWCGWCKEDYWYDCPHKSSKCNCDCKCKVDVKCPDCICRPNVTLSTPQECQLNRPVIPNSEERPQVDVTLLVNENPQNRAVVAASAALSSQSNSRTLQYVCHNITCRVTSTTATLQFVNGVNNPRYTTVLACPSAVCDIRLCQCDTIPGVSFAVAPGGAIPPLTVNVIGAATCSGIWEVGHST